MPLDEEAFLQLKRELMLATIVGSLQKRELVFQDQRRPELKVYIYKEPNHKRPHVHIYFGGDEAASVCIGTRDVLAGTMNAKLLKPIRLWMAEHEVDLHRVWSEIQQGKKSELLWAQDV
ncbi:MAG: DUF4160 domain-containing protein [Rhodoferax sp.]|nr:DUF4160 domain-containing protein [Rhodoferax sp.]